MPLDDENDTTPKKTLKNIGTVKSMFENSVKKPTQQDFEKKVADVVNKDMLQKKRIGEAADKFMVLMSDKTLTQNQTVFS
jgi:hypothetical protein